MPKYIIRDEDGKEYEVTETKDEEIEKVGDDDLPHEGVHDDDTLAPEEITALKRLAGVADKLIALIAAKDEEPTSTEDEGMEETLGDDEEEIEKKDCGDDGEEVIETKTGDSKSAVGSLRKTKDSKVDDALNRENAIADAWSKYYTEIKKRG